MPEPCLEPGEPGNAGGAGQRCGDPRPGPTAPARGPEPAKDQSQPRTTDSAFNTGKWKVFRAVIN